MASSRLSRLRRRPGPTEVGPVSLSVVVWGFPQGGCPVRLPSPSCPGFSFVLVRSVRGDPVRLFGLPAVGVRLCVPGVYIGPCSAFSRPPSAAVLASGPSRSVGKVPVSYAHHYRRAGPFCQRPAVPGGPILCSNRLSSASHNRLWPATGRAALFGLPVVGNGAIMQRDRSAATTSGLRPAAFLRVGFPPALAFSIGRSLCRAVGPDGPRLKSPSHRWSHLFIPPLPVFRCPASRRSLVSWDPSMS